MEDGGMIELDTARAERSVWLMKCPSVVSHSWQSSAAASARPNPVLAKVVVSVDLLRADNPSSPQFKMEMAETASGNAPNSYSLNMFKDFVPMCVFAESAQGKFSTEGKVEYKFDLEPHSENIGDYRKFCQERTKKAMIKTRKVQILDKDNGLLMRPLPGMVGLAQSGPKHNSKLQPAKGPDAKRTRKDRREMESIIFNLFERQSNWALKQLVRETDQPEQFLKEILHDICIYNKRGPNQGTHELKPEYRKTTDVDPM